MFTHYLCRQSRTLYNETYDIYHLGRGHYFHYKLDGFGMTLGKERGGYGKPDGRH